MRFDLEKTGEWFQFFKSEIKPDGEIIYFDPEEDAGKVCLKIADTETLDTIHAQTRKKMAEFVVNKQTRQMERVSYYEQTPAQEKMERGMIWDYAIVDWTGLLDSKGELIPCTLENKLKLMSIPVFARFVGRCIQLLSTSANIEDKKLEKNL